MYSTPLKLQETADVSGQEDLSVDSADEGNTPRQQRRKSMDQDHTRNLCLTFEDISYSVTVSPLKAAATRSQPGHVPILKGISGYVTSGELMAVMGPSGAGKTSLLDILAHRIKKYEGQVAINGSELDHDVLTYLCSYVPQTDSLWSALTVNENLMYASRLYSPSFDERKHTERVDGVLTDLGLVGCQDVKIGNVLLRGVSGGQKRRASIGVELVSGRSVLFLDEPTSGLDSASASTIMQHLKNLAKNHNMIIVASIHQPSTHVFYSFDKLLLLSRGRTAYIGPADDAMSFFTEILPEPVKMMNPADWLLEMINADFTEESKVDAVLGYWQESDLARLVQEEVAASAEHCKDTLNQLPPRAQAVFSRVWSLISRAWLNYMRDPASYILRLVVIASMSVFLGAAYSGLKDSQQDILDTAYLIQWGLAFNSYVNMVALPAFALERNSVNKEFSNGQYHIYQFVLGNAAAQIPFVAAMAVLASTAFYWIAGLNDEFSRYVQYCIIMFGQLYYIESLAALLATVIPDDVLALAVFGSVVSVLFVFNGFFVSVRLMPEWLGWIQYVSPFKYAWEAMANIVYSGRDFEGCEAGETVCIGTTGDEAMDFFSTGSQDIAVVNIWTHFCVILTLAVGVRLLLSVALVKQHK